MPETTELKIELKSVHVNQRMSDETTCFTAMLYVDGKRTAHVKDTGQGGCHQYDLIQLASKSQQAKAQERFDLFKEYAENADLEFEFEKMDQVVDKLLYTWETEKQHKQWCKSNVVFRLKGDKEGEWRTIPHRGQAERAHNHVTSKHGDDVEEILNDRY